MVHITLDVTRRTITLIKAAPHKIVEGRGEQVGGGDEEALRPLTETLSSAAMGNSAPALAATRRSAVTPSRHLSVAPSSRRITRARRLPAWYKDYDTDYIGAGEESPTVEATIKSRLPAGIELTDPNAAGGEDGVPTEEWNVVVYDDEEPIERSDDKEEGGVTA